MISNSTGISKTHKNIYMTKEKWESVVLEMPDYQYVDPVMYEKCAKKLGMAYATFWKWYNVWIRVWEEHKGPAIYQDTSGDRQ